MDFNAATNPALATAWHRQSAQSSLERWFEVCDKEQWGLIPAGLPLLIRVFGASWYFTRYIFYRGKAAADLIDNVDAQAVTPDNISQRLSVALQAGDLDRQLDKLRLFKNEIMLQILACSLSGEFNQQQTEQALTILAEATLFTAMSVFGLHTVSGCRIAALGMGRMAGYEMTFGSDLDLIFLFAANADESVADLSRKVRLLMRHLSAAASAGTLYDVDMRLRPHGTSGALLTSTGSFLDYHRAEREIWERQIMTRCRPVSDAEGLGREILHQIMPYVYASYDEDTLRREIVAMRNRVETEKGSPRGKFNVKQGKGGLMDIDFLCHFLQLYYTHRYSELQTGSTRKALAVLADKNIITLATERSLLEAYDFLKQIEACVRLFDMKPVSTIADNPEANTAVAMAMGFDDDVNGLMDKYLATRASVRKLFIEIVGDPEKPALT